MASASGEHFENRSPVDGSRLGEVAAGDASDVDSACVAAEEAFPAWSALPGKARQALLHRVADGIVARQEEIALVECMDTGQAIRFMSKAALRGAENFRFFADRAPGARDGLSLPAQDHVNYTTRQPIGPVGVITPWNTPFMLSTWKIAPALAAGCTVVHKPAEWSPYTAALLAEIAQEAGLPDGVLNVVHGMGESAGRALTEHPAVRAIAFVGESRTGGLIQAQGAPSLKRLHFELGGKNPVIVFADADLERAPRRRGLHDLQPERRALHLFEPAPGGGLDPRRLHRASGRARRRAARGAPARPGDRARPADPPAPLREGHGLLRDGPGGGARSPRGGHRDPNRFREDVMFAPRSSAARARPTVSPRRRSSDRCSRCSRSRPRPRRSRSPTASTTGWPATCGPATSAAPTAWPGTSKRAWSG